MIPMYDFEEAKAKLELGYLLVIRREPTGTKAYVRGHTGDRLARVSKETRNRLLDDVPLVARQQLAFATIWAYDYAKETGK